MIRAAFYAGSLALVTMAALVVPMPLVEIAPGGVTPIPPLITVGEEVETSPIEGELSLLTVRILRPTLVEAVRAALAPARDLEPREAVIPRGVEEDLYFDHQRSEFWRAFQLAVAVGLREAGHDVPISTAPLVLQVLPDGPAAGALRSGDVIRAIDGQPTPSTDDVIAATGALEIGAPATITIVRDGEERTVEITPGRVAGREGPAIGISLGTDIVTDLPFPVTLSDTDIGGPSAGLMVALTVYDLVSAEDLTRGRRIAGTGTIRRGGEVGPIGGIQEKVVAAAESGVDVLLVPAAQAAEVRAVAPEGLRVIPVATLSEAITALRGA